jgi:hypothetical protein
MQHHERTSGTTDQPFRFSLRSLFLVTTIAALLVCAYVWYVNNLSFSLSPDIDPKPFDETTWKEWSVEDMRQSEDTRRVYARREMEDDLLKKYNFSGWSTAEVASLLGPSDPDFCPPDWDIAYLLGPDWIDYVALVFRLNDDGKVDAYRVIVF